MKLSLKKLLEFGGPVTPGLRPEGPSGKNKHKFPHHGLYGKYGGFKPKTPDTGPFPDATSDLRNGDDSAEIEAEPDDLPLEEFFKFTKSANDNTSFYRPPTYGRGAMAAYGKSSKEYGAYDPTVDGSDEEDRDDVRQQTIKGRAYQKAKVFEFAGPGLRYRNPRDENDYSTNEPFASGIPGRDKKDIVNGDEKIDELIKDMEKEGLEESLQGADSAWSKMNGQKISRSPRSDLNFWDIIEKNNVYSMNSIDEFEDEQKKRKKE